MSETQFRNKYGPQRWMFAFSALATSFLLVLAFAALLRADKQVDYQRQSILLEESLLKFRYANRSAVAAFQAFFAASEKVTRQEFELFSARILGDIDHLTGAGMVRQVTGMEVGADTFPPARFYGLSAAEQQQLERGAGNVTGDHFPIAILHTSTESTGLLQEGWDLKPLFALSGIDSGAEQLQYTVPFTDADGNLVYMLAVPIKGVAGDPDEAFVVIPVFPLRALETIPLGAGFTITLLSQEGAGSPGDGARVRVFSGAAVQQEYVLPRLGTWRETFPLQLGNREFVMRLQRPYSATPLEVALLSVLLLANLAIHLLLFALYKNRYLRVRADAANEAKSNFLAMMSHEIRTPLNGVMGMADILRQTELSPRQQQYIEMIINSGNSLLSVINDVLDSEKIEAGKLHLETVEFNLHHLFSQLSTIFSSARQGPSQQFSVSIAPGTPEYLYGDPARLRQVVTNLLSNAFKFTESGLISLRVDSRVQSVDRCDLQIRVRDQGIGMNDEQLQHLFRPFQQAGSDIYRKYGGTGLGLSICHRLVGMMGGSIQVDSEPGQGSCFTVNLSLPCAAHAQPDLSELTGCSLLLICEAVPSRQCVLEQARALQLQVSEVDDIDAMQRQLAAGSLSELDYLVLMPGQGDTMVPALAALLREYRPQLRARLLLFSDMVGAQLYDNRDYQIFDQIAGIPVSVEQMAESLQGGSGSGVSVQCLPEDTGASGQRPLLVLVVEDNPVNVKVVTVMLQKMGHRVHAVDNGDSAIAYFSEHCGRIDLVLMDCEMPRRDGFETTRALRAIERDLGEARKPVIALTAHVGPHLRQRCLDAGMDDYLAKPLSLRTLSRALQCVSDGKSGMADNGRHEPAHS